LLSKESGSGTSTRGWRVMGVYACEPSVFFVPREGQRQAVARRVAGRANIAKRGRAALGLDLSPTKQCKWEEVQVVGLAHHNRSIGERTEAAGQSHRRRRCPQRRTCALHPAATGYGRGKVSQNDKSGGTLQRLAPHLSDADDVLGGPAGRVLDACPAVHGLAIPGGVQPAWSKYRCGSNGVGRDVRTVHGRGGSRWSR
jgi:hypothetical protein